MRILGITAEYDPFHNGHRYHLDTAKEAVDPDVTLCVMSGDFTQRGELAVLDKWDRAEIAVDQGLDMVLELPFLYAVSPAASFASGAVDILVMAGATHIAFGCEAEDPEMLTELAHLQIKEAEKIELLARQEMKSGLSYVKARQNATTKIAGEELTSLSLAPNNILALEYLKRMMYWKDKGKRIEAVPVLRKGSGYKEIADEASEQSENGTAQRAHRKYAGGSAIRDIIDAGWDVEDYIPYDIRQWVDLRSCGNEILRQLKGIVLRSTPEEISRTRFVGEGLENKLIREITDAGSYRELLKKMTSRRYTTSTIRRILICLLLGLTKDAADMVSAAEGPSDANRTAEKAFDAYEEVLYGRVLALADGGRRLISSEPGLPFIVNVNRTEGISEEALECLMIDVRAADLYNLLAGRDSSRNTDHRRKPYIRQGGSR